MRLVTDLGVTKIGKEKYGKGRAIYECPECMKPFTAIKAEVKRGKRMCSACGYGNRYIANKSHNLSKHTLYIKLQNMHDRCKNINNRHYGSYGGRGIRVSEEWSKIEPFYEWALLNGWEEGLTIERIDNDGDYEPSNCMFIPFCEQGKNKIGSVQNRFSKYEILTIKKEYEDTPITQREISKKYKLGVSTMKLLLKGNYD